MLTKLHNLITDNEQSVTNLLTLARLRSKALKIHNKVGALIVNLNTNDYVVGWNYSMSTSLEKLKTGESATVHNLSIPYKDDDLVTNHDTIIHAEAHAIDNLNKQRNLADFNMPAPIFEELEFPTYTIEARFQSEVNYFLEKLNSTIEDAEIYLNDLKELYKEVVSYNKETTYVCFVTKEPCETCKNLLIENNINLIVYPINGIFKVYKLEGDSYKYAHLNYHLNII